MKARIFKRKQKTVEILEGNFYKIISVLKIVFQNNFDVNEYFWEETNDNQGFGRKALPKYFCFNELWWNQKKARVLERKLSKLFHFWWYLETKAKLFQNYWILTRTSTF